MRLFYSALSLFALLQTTAQTKAAEHADWIIRAKYVATMDAHHRVIDRGAVAIRGTRVVGVGRQSEIGQRFEANRRRPSRINDICGSFFAWSKCAATEVEVAAVRCSVKGFI